jgi:hypothetical protein
VHRRLGQQRKHRGANVAATGPVTSVMAVESPVEAAAARAVVSPAAPVAVSPPLGVPDVVGDPLMMRILMVVVHVVPFCREYRVHSRYIDNISWARRYSAH